MDVITSYSIHYTKLYDMQHILIVVSSLAIGSLLGEWWNLEAGAEKMSEYLKKKLHIGSERFTEGLITAFLLYCIGAMTIVGAINEGTGGVITSYSIHYTKLYELNLFDSNDFFEKYT